MVGFWSLKNTLSVTVSNSLLSHNNSTVIKYLPGSSWNSNTLEKLPCASTSTLKALFFKYSSLFPKKTFSKGLSPGVLLTEPIIFTTGVFVESFIFSSCPFLKETFLIAIANFFSPLSKTYKNLLI